ncbi:Protein FAM217B [Merluccius polli]|uniref:Protein FAM217B n=1 Tax=Merluccius polli TaxID=89951 RepID=A0AA47NCL9_MERPO|nr:Protein FAM217B [Merluccius polli]
MVRRQAQRKSPLPHHTPSRTDNNNHHFPEKRSQQRRKNKANVFPAAKCTSLQTSAQGSPAAAASRVTPSASEGREGPRPRRCRPGARGQHLQPGVHPHRCPPDSSPDPLGGEGPQRGPEGPRDPGEDADGDRDLSDTERLPASPSPRASSAAPPQLVLRPEVFAPDDLPPDPRGPRGRGGPRPSSSSSSYPYPDFLPPPFNTWSLAQLASFYHTESRRTPRPRPSDPLERFLERLLQLEWRRMQTAQQEEGGVGARDACEAPAGCHRACSSSAATHLAVRLSSPKSILQCQRAFPLTFLSSLAIDSALLSGCGCSQCRQRYAHAAASSSSLSSVGGGARRCRCPSAHARPSSGPLAERVPIHPLPRRSHSETRAWASAERGPARTRGRPPLSPARGNNNNGHLRRMQALGNLRNPASSGPGPPAGPPTGPPAGRDLPEVSAPRDGGAGGVERSGGGYGSAGWRNRSYSEHRGGRAGGGGGGGAERYEKRRSGSEGHRGAYERRRASSALGGHDIKPDAVAAIMDNLPRSRTKKSKQVEFVT